MKFEKPANHDEVKATALKLELLNKAIGAENLTRGVEAQLQRRCA